MYKRLIPLYIVIGLALFIPFTQVQALRNETSRLIHPIGHWLVVRNTTLNRWYHNLIQIGSLRQDKENLQQQVINLQKKLATQDEISHENEVLRQELNVPATRRTLPQVLGNIILRGGNPLDQTFVIDIGRSQGVREGQAVVSQGYIVGRIITARDNTAIVRSITSKQSVIQAWLSETRQKGLLIGDGTTFYLSNVDQGVTVAPHSLIETSGLGGSLPQGIMIGTTGAIQSKPNNLSQKFAVEQPLDLSNLNSVFVITSNPS